MGLTGLLMAGAGGFLWLVLGAFMGYSMDFLSQLIIQVWAIKLSYPNSETVSIMVIYIKLLNSNPVWAILIARTWLLLRWQDFGVRHHPYGGVINGLYGMLPKDELRGFFL